MKRALLLLLALAACGKPAPVADEAAAGPRLIAFDGQNGAFSCKAPADWKTREEGATGGPLALFFGPASGAHAGVPMIRIARYPGAADRIKTPQEYWETLKLTDKNPSALETKQLNGRTVYVLHDETPEYPPHGRKVLYMNREDTVLVPCKDGFFQLTHSAPADSYQSTLPVFDALVSSFEPKS